MVWFLPLYIGKGKTCCFDEIFRLIFPGIYPSYISVESYDIYALSFPTNYPSFYRFIYSVLFIILAMDQITPGLIKDAYQISRELNTQIEELLF